MVEMEHDSGQAFDPSRYLSRVIGGEYLEVKWRLVWVRDRHPDAEIETELIDHRDQLAMFRTRISIPGGGNATGWGSEHYSDFRDYIEKAETKAIARALAALGFGTQFSIDDETGLGAGAKTRSSSSQGRSQRSSGSRPASQGGGGQITPNQVDFVWSLVERLGRERDSFLNWLKQEYGGASVEELSKAQASGLIKRLQSIGKGG